MEVNPPSYSANSCYTAEQDRMMWGSLICTEGVCNSLAGDLKVTATNPASLSVNVAEGCAWIQGDTVEDQGFYYVRNDATKTVTLGGADPVDPRIDRIVARVYDAQYSGTETKWVLEVVPGTPSPTPVAPAVPPGAISLATVYVAANATATGTITDTRTQMQLCHQIEEFPFPTAYVAYTGTGTFVKANYPGLRGVKVIVQGGGGGGGAVSVTYTNEAAAGGGGGGGGYAERSLYAASLAATENVVVGAGGAGGIAAISGDGKPGGLTYFGGWVSATGGQGGLYGFRTANGYTNGGAPGMGQNGYLNLSGQYGERGRVYTSEVKDVGIGGDSHLGHGGTSPPAYYAGGSGGSTLDYTGGRIYGGGGTGAFANENTDPGIHHGGDGAAGLSVVYLYF